MELPTAKLNYTTINHPAREELGLTWMEYGLTDLIFRLSNNPESDYPSWCYASKDTLAANLGLTKQGVHKILNRLLEKGLVVRHEKTKHLKVTIDWYQIVEINKSKQSLLGVNNVDPQSKQSLLNKERENNIINSKELIGEAPKDPQKKIYGNPEVNSILEVFTQKSGLDRPTDKFYRQEAWLFHRQHTKFGNTAELFGKAYDFFSEEWDMELVSTIGSIRRNMPVYLKKKRLTNNGPTAAELEYQRFMGGKK